MASQDGAILIAVGAVIALILMLVAIFIWIDYIDDDGKGNSSAPSSSGGSSSAGTSTASSRPSGGWSAPSKKRVWTSGVRLDELLSWSTLEATEALAAYASQMVGDEREAFYVSLPQIANAVLGLDHGPGSPRGWLNDQSNLLVEPNKNLRDAQQLHARLLGLLAAASAAPPSTLAAGSPTKRGAGGFGGVLSMGGAARPSARTKPGVVLEKLIDAGLGPEVGMRYTFFTKHLPPPVKQAMTDGRLHLLPPLFACRLPVYNGQVGGGPAGGGPRPGSETPQSLVLAAWEYYIFCFLLWPLSDGGERAMDSFPAAPAASSLGISSLGSVLGGAQQTEPLYLTLLGSYLGSSIPLNAPYAEGGALLLQAISQFWLCQNADAVLASQLSVVQSFQDTKASVLSCLWHVVLHLNAHETKRIAALPNAPSAHAALAAPMYHFFERQIHGLPDVSSRVIVLIRLFTLYLHPWQRPSKEAAQQTSQQTAPPASAAVGVGGACAATASAEAPSATGGRAHELAEAEAWAWAPFVRANYLLYVRLLVGIAREVRLGRFRLTEKRELMMLREVSALFDSVHVLALLRQLGEATEAMLQQNLPARSPLRAVVEAHLLELEGDPTRWRAAVEAYLPAAVYKELDQLDKHLQGKVDEFKRREQSKSFFDSSGAEPKSSSPTAVLDKLRGTAQRALRELQPTAAAEIKTVRPVESRDFRPEVKMLGVSAQPLSDEDKHRLATGRARCSKLNVPYRVTPRQPVRPVGSGEIALLVELSERLASAMPPALLHAAPALHPRLLASVPSLGLCAVYGVLLAVRPVGDSTATLVLSSLWWALTIPALLLGTLHVRHWTRRHGSVSIASAESWLPYLADELRRGTTEAELYNYLKRVLPPSERTLERIERLIGQARQRVQ